MFSVGDKKFLNSENGVFNLNILFINKMLIINKIKSPISMKALICVKWNFSLGKIDVT